MKRHGLVISVILVFILFLAGSASAFYMNFEEGLGKDGQPITGIPGVTFTTSEDLPWVYGDATTGSWNVKSIDTGQSWGTGSYQMYGYVFAWLGPSGSWGRINFDDQNGTWFQTGVTSLSDFYLEAYNSSGTLIDTAILAAGNTNGSDMAWLRVQAPSGQYISYVIMHDSGNYWLADNMTGDMFGGVPLPPSVWLLGSGLLGLGAYRWRKLISRS
jgi:hypothetical protein